MKNRMNLERRWKLKPAGTLAYEILNWKRANLFVIQLLRGCLNLNVSGVEPCVILNLIDSCQNSIENGGILLAFLRH